MLNIDSQGRTQAKIRYSLQPVPPKARSRDGTEGPYAAHVQIRPASLRSIAEQMVREGSKYSEFEIIAIVSQLMETIAYRLTNGESVNLGSMLRLKPAIRGTFSTLETPFNATEHEIVVSATIGSNLRKIIQQATVEHIERSTSPKLLQVVPFDASSANMPNFSFIVRGSHLTSVPKGATASWFIRANNKQTTLTPVVYDSQKALFQLPYKQYPVGTTFQIGLRLQLANTTFLDFLYKDAVVVG